MCIHALELFAQPAYRSHPSRTYAAPRDSEVAGSFAVRTIVVGQLREEHALTLRQLPQHLQEYRCPFGGQYFLLDVDAVVAKPFPDDVGHIAHQFLMLLTSTKADIFAVASHYHGQPRTKPTRIAKLWQLGNRTEPRLLHSVGALLSREAFRPPDRAQVTGVPGNDLTPGVLVSFHRQAD